VLHVKMANPVLRALIRCMACLVKHQADGLWCVLAWSMLR